MHPLKVSAQFAAFLWFTKGKRPSSKLNRDASRYARVNWSIFVPNAHDGIGRLLLKLATPDSSADSSRPIARRSQPKLAVAS